MKSELPTEMPMTLLSSVTDLVAEYLTLFNIRLTLVSAVPDTGSRIKRRVLLLGAEYF